MKNKIKEKFPFFMPLYQSWANPLRRIFNIIHNPQILVLMYHRISDEEMDPYTTIVNLDKFESQIKFLKHNYNIIRLTDDWQNINEKSIVITFDDGYVDNYTNAFPILEKYKAPATIFVATGNINTNKEFWDNDFIRMLLYRNKKNDFLNLNEKKIFLKNDDDIKNAIYIIHDILNELSPLQRDIVLKNIEQQLKPTKPYRENYRTLNDVELKLLDESFSIDIGCHTVSHSRLATENEKEQEYEIFHSTQYLEKVLGHRIDSFAFPFGKKSDYNQTSIALLKKYNYKKAATTCSGQVHKIYNPYEIPRWAVGNWNLEDFKTRLDIFWKA
jgi:peptidoglycan/xylan/chitin deacetylase (PgdA/CDA1 family)